jgi:hypothetical protein
VGAEAIASRLSTNTATARIVAGRHNHRDRRRLVGRAPLLRPRLLAHRLLPQLSMNSAGVPPHKQCPVCLSWMPPTTSRT